MRCLGYARTRCDVATRAVTETLSNSLAVLVDFFKDTRFIATFFYRVSRYSPSSDLRTFCPRQKLNSVCFVKFIVGKQNFYEDKIIKTTMISMKILITMTIVFMKTLMNDDNDKRRGQATTTTTTTIKIVVMIMMMIMMMMMMMMMMMIDDDVLISKMITFH